MVIHIWLDEAQNHITEVVEKEVISNEATVSTYNFARGQYFCRAARAMFDKNLRVNNEFYVAPAYNILSKKAPTLAIIILAPLLKACMVLAHQLI